jgi:hypothetical protein
MEQVGIIQLYEKYFVRKKFFFCFLKNKWYSDLSLMNFKVLWLKFHCEFQFNLEASRFPFLAFTTDVRMSPSELEQMKILENI